MWKYREPDIDNYDNYEDYQEAMAAFDNAVYDYLERVEDARHCD